MRKEPAAICFHCGGRAEPGGRLNRLQGGEPCPSCAERLLATLPPLLPGFRLATDGAEAHASPADSELDEPA